MSNALDEAIPATLMALKLVRATEAHKTPKNTTMPLAIRKSNSNLTARGTTRMSFQERGWRISQLSEASKADNTTLVTFTMAERAKGQQRAVERRREKLLAWQPTPLALEMLMRDEKRQSAMRRILARMEKTL